MLALEMPLSNHVFKCCVVVRRNKVKISVHYFIIIIFLFDKFSAVIVPFLIERERERGGRVERRKDRKKLFNGAKLRDMDECARSSV